MALPSSTIRAQSGGGSTIVQTAIDAGSFQTLVTAVKAAGLVETLNGPGPLTVFAPTDEAFAKLPAGTIESLLKPENKAQLTAILTHHVVAGRVTAAQVVGLTGATTVGGQRVDISTSDAGVQVDGANVTTTDIACSNGIIHVIDTVLLPVSDTIVEVAENAGSFGTLLAAATAAGLVDTLNGDGPLTVFAPTEEAFGALPKGTVANLLQPQNKAQLAELLTYHVVAGRVYSDAALSLPSAPTVAGGSITITPTERGGLINNARLVQTDIDASNGVIHVIDRVLLPGGAGTGAVAAMRPAMDNRRTALTVLDDAVKRGVPMFNGGDQAGCAAIYMAALQQVVAMQGTGMSAESIRQAQSMLRACGQMQSETSKAWALRGQIDRIMLEL